MSKRKLKINSAGLYRLFGMILHIERNRIGVTTISEDVVYKRASIY